MAEKKYTIQELPIEKKIVAEIAALNRHVNLMHSHFIVDITEMRKQMKVYKQETKISLSILTCLLYCFARTLDKYKESTVLLGKGNKLFTFDEIDVFFPFELRQEDKKFIWYKIMRRVNKKSIVELQNDIKSLTTMKKEFTRFERFFMAMPLFIRNWLYDITMRNPLHRKSYYGNVYFSSTIHNSNKRLLAYGMPTPFHSAGMFVGTYINVTNPTNGTPNTNLLAMTISLDHHISDGPMLGHLVTDFFDQVEKFRL
jgi:hypothetical protein